MLVREMKFIAETIAYTDFYFGSNNHDYPMLLYAVEFNDIKMVKIGTQRLEEYF